MIRLDALSKSYGGTEVLHQITFDVERGEVVGLLGPNGAGKTTCLRVLTCFVPPGAGTAWVDEMDVRSHSREVRRRVGYLPEGVPLYPELRVVETLVYRAALRGIGRRRCGQAIDRVIEICGLGEVRRRIVGQLSRGYRQRLGLATALLGDPPVVVLDEPTVGLDPNQVREVRQLIRSLGGEHTVLISTHRLTEVEAICSRAVIIHRGRLVAQGPINELRSEGRAVVTIGGPAEEASRVLEGVDGVEVVTHEGSRFWLHGASSPEDRARVAAAVVSAGLALQELSWESSGLEDVFAKLTGEAGEVAG